MHDICQVESTTAVDASQIYRISFLSFPIIAMPVLVGSEPPKKQFFNFFGLNINFFAKLTETKSFYNFFLQNIMKRKVSKNPKL